MNTRFTRILCLTPILAPLLFVAAPALAGDLLDDLTGSWTGRGTLRSGPTEAYQSVRCKINGRSQGVQLVLSGSCAVPGRKLNFGGSIEEIRPGVYSGSWSNPVGGGSTRISGKQSGSSIRFTFIARHPETSERLNGRMVWNIGKNRLMISSSGATAAWGKTVALGKIDFSR